MILTIRTDKPESELALFDGEKKVSEVKWQAHRQLAETIHIKIRELLDGQGLTPEQLSGVVAYEGPGSFTGLRIGLAVANSLGYALDIPRVGASGDQWQLSGISKLVSDKTVKTILPAYGSSVHVTLPKK